MTNINKNFDEYVDYVLSMNKLLDEPPKVISTPISGFGSKPFNWNLQKNSIIQPLVGQPLVGQSSEPINDSMLRNSNAPPFNSLPIKKRNKKVPVPNSDKDDRYHIMRARNNEAARISREKARMEKEDRVAKLISVRKRNEELTIAKDKLQKELDLLKSRIYLLNNGKDADTIKNEYTAKRNSVSTATKTPSTEKTVVGKILLEDKFKNILSLNREDYYKELKFNIDIQNLSDEDKDELKKIRRKFQARINSKNARLRSKNKIINLKEKINIIKKDNTNLKRKINKLKN